MENQITKADLDFFIYPLFKLLKIGAKETCSRIEEEIGNGIASYLFQKYNNEFVEYCFNENNAKDLDEYFKTTWLGCTEGNELKKYDCSEDEGLWLILCLILNDIKI